MKADFSPVVFPLNRNDVPAVLKILKARTVTSEDWASLRMMQDDPTELEKQVAGILTVRNPLPRRFFL